MRISLTLLRGLARRRLLLAVLASFVLWTACYLARKSHPFGGISDGVFTDHFSHMNTTRLFPSVGIGIWTSPIRSHGRPLSPQEKAALPEDVKPAAFPNGEVYFVPGWPEDKPLISGWSHLPRLHPPGDLVLTGPVALLYHYTRLSFSGANRLLIVVFLGYAHISLYFLGRAWLKRPEGAGYISTLAQLVVYFELVHWSLEGFYEGAVVAPLVLCAGWIHERKPVHAILAYCVAANIHFRAFFFAPWVIYAALIVVREKHWRSWRLAHWVMLAAAAALTFTSLGVFHLLWPTLKSLPLHRNSISLSGPTIDHGALLAYGIVAVITCAGFFYTRSYLDIAVLGWVTFMLISLREMYAWDITTLLAWTGASVPRAATPRLLIVRDVRTFFILFVAAFLFGNSMMPSWLTLFSRAH